MSTIIRDPIVRIMADDKIEPNNSDQIQRNDTPEKGNNNKGCPESPESK